MKKSILFLFIIITLFVSFNSCKTEFISPTFKPAPAASIAKLPESERIKGKEIMDWYAANLQNIGLEPHWDKPKQTVFHKHHVILVFVGPDAGLFFTKINGVLKVDAYRWRERSQGERWFTGDVIDYCFQTNKLSALVYHNSMLVRSGTMQIPPIYRLGFIDKIMLSDVWSWIESYKK